MSRIRIEKWKLKIDLNFNIQFSIKNWKLNFFQFLIQFKLKIKLTLSGHGLQSVGRNGLSFFDLKTKQKSKKFHFSFLVSNWKTNFNLNFVIEFQIEIRNSSSKISEKFGKIFILFRIIIFSCFPARQLFLITVFF